MTDLLASLVVPSSPRSSQDSFRSISSQPQVESPPLSSISNSSSAPSALPIFPASAHQAAGLPVYDVDSYLNANPDLRSNPPKPVQYKKASTKTPASTDTPEPVSVGTKTSFYVAALNTQCQLKGFFPVFEIEGEPSIGDFGGVLKLGDVTITSDQRWRSKKEAREGLAERGLEAVKEIEPTRKEPGAHNETGRNWVGMLQEYHALTDPNLGPTYHDYAVGSAYACTCSVPSLGDRIFGSTTNAFPNKKGARANAARDAVEYLISKEVLNQDGSTKARKKTKLGAAVRVHGAGLEVRRGTTYTQRVNDIYPLLGLTSPQYVLKPVSPNAPNMLSGYATFPNSLDVAQEMGEVSNIFGKKKAKEEVAKGVWEVLKALAAKRNVNIAEEDDSDISWVDD